MSANRTSFRRIQIDENAVIRPSSGSDPLDTRETHWRAPDSSATSVLMH
jgi:hypothetical protein